MIPQRPTQREPDGWRTFLWLWGSQSLSLIGGAVSSFAFSIYLTQTRFPLESQKPQLAAALSLTGLAWALAATFITPLAGSWADRYPRQKLIQYGDLISAGLSFAMLGLILLPAAPLWTLILLSALVGTVATVHGSAFDAIVSTVVPTEKLPRANGMMQTLWSISGLVGPALGAFLIGIPALLRQGDHALPGVLNLHDGVPFAYLLDGLSFLLAAFVMMRLFIPVPPDEPGTQGHQAPPPGSVKQDMQFGWNFIRIRPGLRLLLVATATANLCLSGLFLVYPLLAKFTLAADWQARSSTLQASLAILTTSASVGALLGGLLVSTQGGLKQRRVLGVLIPMLLAALAVVVLGRVKLVWAAAGALCFMGFMEPIYAAHLHSIWQMRVPRAMQGRVFSIRRLIGQITQPLSAVLIGVLAARYSPSLVPLVLGGFMVAVIAVLLMVPEMQRADEQEPPAAPPAVPTTQPQEPPQ